MKKILIALICTILCFSAHAQHVPLKHIEVPDFPTTQIRKDYSNNFAKTINTYSAIFSFTWCFRHEVGYKEPDLDYNVWGLSLVLDQKQDLTLRIKAKAEQGLGDLLQGAAPLYLTVGGKHYVINTWYYATGNKRLMLDFEKNIVEHVSVSGLQGIYTETVSEENKIIVFNEVQQELWRRSAEEVYSKRKVYN